MRKSLFFIPLVIPLVCSLALSAGCTWRGGFESVSVETSSSGGSGGSAGSGGAAGGAGSGGNGGSGGAMAAPELLDVSPAVGLEAGGEEIKLTGTGFRIGATVQFGNAAATCEPVASAVEITCTAPANSAGAVDVTVTNDDAQVTSLSNAYTYAAQTLFAWGPAAATVGHCSGRPITIEFRDGQNEFVVLPQDTEVTAANLNGGQLYSDAGCTTPLAGGTFVASSGSLLYEVFFLPSQSVAHSIEFSAPGFRSTTFDIWGSVPFGSTGYVSQSSLGGGSDDRYLDVAIDSFGRIVAVGTTQEGISSTHYRTVVSRYDASGTLDTSFGNGGHILGPLEGWVSYGIDNDLVTENFDAWQSVVIDEQNRIVVAGWSQFLTTPEQTHGVIARYTASGELDSTFGDDAEVGLRTGCIIGKGDAFDDDDAQAMPDSGNRRHFAYGLGGAFGPEFVENLYSIVLDSQQRLVVGGTSSSNIAATVVARFAADGSALDTTFGGSGIILQNNGTNWSGNGNTYDVIRDVRITGNDSVVGIGWARDSLDETNFFTARWTSTGVLDTEFYGGYRLFSASEVQAGGNQQHSYGGTVDKYGNVIVAGTSHPSGTLLVSRFTPEGELDTTTWSPDGFWLASDTLIDGWDDGSTDVEFDGRFSDYYVLGYVNATVDPPWDTGGAFVSRFTWEGQPDSRFGTNGTVAIDDLIPSSADLNNFSGMAIDSQSNVVVVGQSLAGSEAIVVRLRANGELDAP